MLGRILLAEDDPRLQSLGRKVLERQGYTVSVAGDGDEAVQMAADHDYEVILMDLSMPRMDGYEAMQRIKQFKPALPIVAVTAHAMKSDRERCLEQGFDEHLAKPYEVPLLMAVVASFASDWAKSIPSLKSVSQDPAVTETFLGPASPLPAPTLDPITEPVRTQA
jgi:CheY-like chemotaxis protein